MTARLLVVAATEREASAARAAGARGSGAWSGADVITSGIARVNAACATTSALLRAPGAYAGVVSVGIAGALPGSDLALGAVVVADACIYAEEGLVTPDGFSSVSALGFALGDFDGNRVPVDDALLARFRSLGRVAPIATVATCSGTDASARAVAQRTGAIAEAMEGAAVVHAARRLGVAGAEVRVISNTTGERAAQRWDLETALDALSRL